MQRSFRLLSALLVALGSMVVVAACGSSSSTGSGAGKTGGSVTVVQGTAPDYFDPSLSYTTQGANWGWISYLGLYTYAHAEGTAGTQLIPAIATSQPVISNSGKTYTITIRHGLKYSNGMAVKASDFTFSVERAIKLNWGGASFVTNNVVGATAFSKGAKSISGITADNAAGKIVIHLMRPYGALENVLAFPAMGLLPPNTAMKNLSTSPPAGFGPYELKNVVPNVSYDVSLNPNYAGQAVPGVPAGHVNVHVKIETNTTTEASDVLNNSADVFDWGDTLPPALLSQIQSQSSDRYKAEQTALTLYFFLNTTEKPFNNPLARQAVIMALDRNALARLDSGNLTPDCYFLPALLVGHPTAPCPYGNPAAAPNLAAAKKLVAQAGLTGTPVTVWGQERSPRKEYVDYYASVLNSLGFKATTKIIASASYFPTIETLKLHPQTGFADWQQDFPNPIDFYLLLSKAALQPTGNQNFGEVSDPVIEKGLAKLSGVPSSQLSSVASQWQTLDEYVAKKAYVAVFGYEKTPKFTSNRINFGSLLFHPLYGNDWSSLQLK
ncbi:MAG: ABC transporter substrate-binding protein [Solirubrobacteraceae bacterium]|nr:MAG: hypothetical protein DLM63_09145 [Solirubrobacterales bacterium]